MKLGKVAGTFGAGAVFYVAMAACSASDSPSRGITSGDGASSSSGSGSGGLIDAIADAITNPVGDAKAAPDVAAEDCNKSFMVATTTFLYAEHIYPGASASDLASVIVLATINNGPPGYSQGQAAAFVRDGAVAVTCGVPGNQTYSSVTFIRS